MTNKIIYDDPIEDVIYNLTEKSIDKFHDWNFTANMITLLSLIISLIALLFYFYEYYIVSGFLSLIAFIFDCMDGRFARKYNDETEFGKYFDKIKDAIIYWLFFLFIYLNKKLEPEIKYILLILYLLSELISLLCFIYKKKKYIGYGMKQMLISLVIISHSLFI